MKIARSLAGFGILVLALGCANQHSEKAAPPAASPDTAVQSAGEAQFAAPPPAPAQAPKGLDEISISHEAARNDDFKSLAEAERALDQAKADLDRLALAEPMGNVAGVAKSEKADSKRAAPSAAGAAGPGAAPVASGQCENACKAFASLTRAANAVCRLDGDGGSHCVKAKKVVTDSAGRVAACTCPAPGQ